jgi:hypothetical protein
MQITYQALSHGPIQVQRRITGEIEGETLSKIKAYVLSPGDDVSDQPEDIQAACAAWWTPERVAAFEASKGVDPEAEDADDQL